MPVPEYIRVKLSSEAAEFVALTAVVIREMPFRELLEHVVSATGPAAARVRDMLKRGSLVSGATRFRWQGWEGDEGEFAAAIAALPQPEPGRPFAAERCQRVTLTGPVTRIEIGRDGASQRRLFQRRCFWECLMEEARSPAYAAYLYKDHADQYRAHLTPEQREKLKTAACLLKFEGLVKQIQRAAFDRMDLIVGR
jgi:hypothetical protein